MGATARHTRPSSRRGSRRGVVTDRQRANALLLLGSGNEEVVADSGVDRILRTLRPSLVVRVRQTKEGHSVYRATHAGQRWAVDQLATSPLHANLIRRRPGDAIEERPNGEWRVIDYARRVRTPWRASAARTPVIERAAKMAVRRTDPSKLVAHRHTRDGDWVVAHSL